MFGLLVFLSLPDCDFQVGEVALVAESLRGAGRQATPHLHGLALQELGELCGDEVLRQSQICRDCLSEKFPSARLFTSTGHAASSKKCLPCCSTVAMPLFTTSTRVYVFTPLYRMSEIQSLATSFDDSTRMSSVRSIFTACYPLHFCSGFCCCFCCFMLFFSSETGARTLSLRIPQNWAEPEDCGR